MTEQSHSLRNGFISAIVFLICLSASWPIAEMGFNDDWSYAKSAQVFAHTGHLVYNGWATAMLGWQIAWGALFVRLFGFSFTAVKLSTVPLAMGALILFHSILVRFGSTGRNAILGTLTLGLSPLFLPLAASFMTDVPGVFVILLCLYCCQRAASARTSTGTIAWLCLAAVSNVAGGTVRQIAWLGALVMVPSTAWLLRNRRGVLLAASLLFAGSASCIYLCMHWFSRQPYSIPESISSAFALDSGAGAGQAFFSMLGIILCLLIGVFPIVAAWLPQIRKVSHRVFIDIFCILLICAAVQWLHRWAIPWSPNVLFWEFTIPGRSDFNFSFHAPFLPAAMRFLASLFVIAAGLVFLATVQTKHQGAEASRVALLTKEAFWLLIPFAVSYAGLLLPRAFSGMLLDRYVLGLMPIVIICLVQIYQLQIGPHLPSSSILTLALLALLAIAGTHNWFASQRARLLAIKEIRSSGVPRTQIDGGFEYDGWTQLGTNGHINNSRIQFPPGSYDPQPEISRVAEDCRVDFGPLMPAVRPQYFLVLEPKNCLAPSKFASVQYSAWLPPFHRTIIVQQIPTAAR